VEFAIGDLTGRQAKKVLVRARWEKKEAAR
jgi:hypothetical protein